MARSGLYQQKHGRIEILPYIHNDNVHNHTFPLDVVSSLPVTPVQIVAVLLFATSVRSRSYIKIKSTGNYHIFSSSKITIFVCMYSVKVNKRQASSGVSRELKIIHNYCIIVKCK